MARRPASKRRRKKQPSCATLERRARRIKDKRKRKAALAKLPKRCRPKGTPPRVPQVPQGTQPPATQMPPPAPGVPGPVPPPPAPGGQAVLVPVPMYRGPFGVRQAERLLWRAGFGPRPGQAQEVAALGLEEAVLRLTRPAGIAPMDGPEPTVGGEPLDPYAAWGHDHLWWFDRMVRSRHQLVERLALVFHDWFATSNATVGSTKLMIDQSNLFRTHALGSFADLVRAVTCDPAMLLWLNGIDNRRGAINENYARELMELFTLGADRGAYTEDDVRQLARAMSGWQADWWFGQGFHNFRWVAGRWDPGVKTVFGKTGAFTWEDGCRLVLEHPLHASFFVRKLWSYFIPVPPSNAVAAALEQRYVASGLQIRPVLEAILCSPELYEGPAMVKPPVVFAAGLLRATGGGITTNGWDHHCAAAGQRLFQPPDVSGWDDRRWLDSNTVHGRWDLVNEALRGHTQSWPASEAYPAETAAQALTKARGFWNDPWLGDETAGVLASFASTSVGAGASGAARSTRQTALRMLIAMSPDHQVS